MNTDTQQTESGFAARNQELEATNAQLKEALQALATELEGFSYAVSHDLRAPLRAVDGFARVLESDYGDKLDAEGRRLLGVIRDSAAQMSVLMNGLLAYSRLGRKEMKPVSVDMTGAAQRVFAEQRAAVPQRKIEISIGDLVPAWADHALVQQVLGHLIANAIKFTGPRDIAQIEIGCHTHDGLNTYYVKDNGVGLDLNYAEKLFGMFQRFHAEDKFEGIGVSLALSQRIVRRHGGSIWAESTPDQGATFYFTLPLEGEGAKHGTRNSRELTSTISQ